MLVRNHFVNGLPELLLMRLLSQHEMYGYELIGEIRARSGERFQFGEGCLYPILHRLSASGHLISRRAIMEGRSRYYYKISPKGRKHLDQLTSQWSLVVQGTEAILHHAYE